MGLEQVRSTTKVSFASHPRAVLSALETELTLVRPGLSCLRLLSFPTAAYKERVAVLVEQLGCAAVCSRERAQVTHDTRVGHEPVNATAE